MDIFTNWKLYVVYAFTLVLFYFMYTSLLSEKAVLEQQVTTLTQNVKTQENLAKLRADIIIRQEELLTKNRETIRESNQRYDDLLSKLDERKDKDNASSDYLKEFFKTLGEQK